MPVANSRIQQGNQAAQQLQLQNAVAAAPTGTQTTRVGQATGAQMAQQSSQQSLAGIQQGLASLQQTGGLGLQSQQTANKQTTAGLQLGADQAQQANLQQMAEVSADAKQQIYDATTQLKKNEAGQTLFDTRQLADYAVASATSAQAYQAQAQQAQQMTEMSLQAMKQAYSLVSEDLTNKAAQARQRGDEAAMSQIAAMQNAAKAQMAAEEAKANNSKAAWTAGGTIVGGVAGTFFGPAGTVAGAAIGGAVGGMIGSQVSGGVGSAPQAGS